MDTNVQEHVRKEVVETSKATAYELANCGDTPHTSFVQTIESSATWGGAEIIASWANSGKRKNLNY